MASICLAILVFLGYFLVIGAAAVIAAGNNAPMRDDDPKAVVIGLGFIASGCLNLVGLVLGCVGTFQPNRSVLCGILGAVFNAVLLFGVIALVCLGLAMGG